MTLVLFLFLTTGCVAGSKSYVFPQSWPSGFPMPAQLEPASTHSSVAPTAPKLSIQVEPLAFDAGLAEPTGDETKGNPATARVLTDLLIEKFRQARVEVSPQSPFVFRGAISRLGYTERKGYPRKLTYTSELVYRLVHRATGEVVWEGELVQEFDQVVLVNTMTKLPADPDAPERILLEKCVDPTWGAIAADVAAFLREKQGA